MMALCVGLVFMVAVFWQPYLSCSAVAQRRQIKQIAALACRNIFAIAFLCGFHYYLKTLFITKNFYGFVADVLFHRFNTCTVAGVRPAKARLQQKKFYH
jgi:hypothetical protein